MRQGGPFFLSLFVLQLQGVVGGFSFIFEVVPDYSGSLGVGEQRLLESRIIRSSEVGIEILVRAIQTVGICSVPQLLKDALCFAGCSITPSVAVEFDILKNPWDADANHVAILENGDATKDIASKDPPFQLYGSGAVSVWIDYDNSAKVLNVI